MVMNSLESSGGVNFEARGRAMGRHDRAYTPAADADALAGELPMMPMLGEPCT